MTWTAPTSNGGSPITGYTVTASDSTTPANGGETCTCDQRSAQLHVTGLTNGDSYTFTVAATNASGPGPRLGCVQLGHPDARLLVPRSAVAATGGQNGTATVTWTAAPSTGGSPITGYTVTATDTDRPRPMAARPAHGPPVRSPAP